MTYIEQVGLGRSRRAKQVEVACSAVTHKLAVSLVHLPQAQRSAARLQRQASVGLPKTQACLGPATHQELRCSGGLGRLQVGGCLEGRVSINECEHCSCPSVVCTGGF